MLALGHRFDNLDHAGFWRNMEDFEPWIREIIELYNQNLMSYSRRNLEDSISEIFKDYGGLVRKFQRKTILATELETISVIFGKGMGAFCLCPNNFPDTKLKIVSSK